MKLVMTLLVRNEAEIIEANLDFHLAQGVDYVIVTDHASTDGTEELLQPYVQAGVVTVLHAEGEAHAQSGRVTRMARLALTEHSADWVINNDADEFWWPLAGSLRDVFASIPPAYGQIEVQRRDFLPYPEGSEPFYSRLVYRDAQSLTPNDRPLQPKVAHRAHPDVVVAPGNHSISGGELLPVPTGELVEIFHFPMRSYEQFERKVIQTGTGYEKLENRGFEEGGDQLKLLEIYRENGLRAYYDQALLDGTQLRRGLESGAIVLDRRLAEFMQARSSRQAPLRRPDGPAARALVASALEGFLELDAARETLVQLRDGAETLERELATTRSELAATSEALGASRSELATTSEALALLRGSSLVRWTAPLRRLYYRLR
jgi:Glycosyl transferase family 2